MTASGEKLRALAASIALVMVALTGSIGGSATFVATDGSTTFPRTAGNGGFVVEISAMEAGNVVVEEVERETSEVDNTTQAKLTFVDVAVENLSVYKRYPELDDGSYNESVLVVNMTGVSTGGNLTVYTSEVAAEEWRAGNTTYEDLWTTSPEDSEAIRDASSGLVANAVAFNAHEFDVGSLSTSDYRRLTLPGNETVPAGNGTDTVSLVGPAPNVSLSPATINGSTSSTVYVPYNATGENVPAGDLEVTLVNTSSGTVVAANSSLSTTRGIAALTIPAGTVGRSFRAEARLLDAGSNPPAELADDRADLTVTTAPEHDDTVERYPVGPSPDVHLLTTYVNSSENTTLWLAYNASTAGVPADDLAVDLVNTTANRVVASNLSLTKTEDFATLEVPAGDGNYSFRARARLLDTRGSNATTLATDTANVTVSLRDAGSQEARRGVDPAARSTDPAVRPGVDALAVDPARRVPVD